MNTRIHFPLARLLLALFSVESASAADEERSRSIQTSVENGWVNVTPAEYSGAINVGVDLQRNRHFPDWHAYDEVVLQDYRSLGGTDEPAWRVQP